MKISLFVGTTILGARKTNSCRDSESLDRIHRLWT